MPDITVTGDEATALEELRRRGGLRQAITTLDSAQQASRQQARAAAAAALHYRPKVLADLLEARGLDVELRDEVQSGQARKVPYVRKAADPHATWETLSSFAPREFAAHLPSLQAAGVDGAVGDDLDVVEFPDNGAPGGGSAGGGDTVDQFIAAQAKRDAARPNPLRPSTTGGAA